MSVYKLFGLLLVIPATVYLLVGAWQRFYDADLFEVLERKGMNVIKHIYAWCWNWYGMFREIWMIVCEGTSTGFKVALAVILCLVIGTVYYWASDVGLYCYRIADDPFSPWMLGKTGTNNTGGVKTAGIESLSLPGYHYYGNEGNDYIMHYADGTMERKTFKKGRQPVVCELCEESKKWYYEHYWVKNQESIFRLIYRRIKWR